mmetsp:Transcript_1038/g.1464  ORF Transcript_1038/g.1464 Transcript_1038/m.1464 type:complete len:511 (-) Transcript_1038:88-1620(-)
MSEPMQFQYNADWPPDSVEAGKPAEFPMADPRPCARITTRVYKPAKGSISTIQNVLVHTMLPENPLRQSFIEMMNQSGGTDADLGPGGNAGDDISTSSSSDDSMSSGSMNSMSGGGGGMAGGPTIANTENNMNGGAANRQPQRAYWMQRTVREAIYGRVLYAIVLKKSFRRDPVTGETAEWEMTEEKCAIKEMSWQHIRRERDKLAENPIQEVAAMQLIFKWYSQQQEPQQHEESDGETAFSAIQKTNVMMPLDLLSDERYLYSIMPYCDGGELFERLDMNERFSEEEARYWIVQVLNGLENLQHAGVCHRDMSLENLLVHQDGALIIDMGMCLRIPYLVDDRNSTTTGADGLTNAMNNMMIDSVTGTPVFSNGKIESGRRRPRSLIKPQGTCGKWIYMSPEILENKQPFDGFAVDMWAAGVILFLMLTGFPPWERACGTDERFKYMTGGYLVQMLTEWELGLSPDAMDLLQRMLFIDPKDRLSLDQVRAHPWIVNGKCFVQSQGTMDAL